MQMPPELCRGHEVKRSPQMPLRVIWGAVRLPGVPGRSDNDLTGIWQLENPTSPGPWVRATTIWRSSHEIPTR